MSGWLRKLRRGGAFFVSLAFLAILLSGCAAPIVAGITLSDISLVAGVVSTATTGKGLSDHALSLATGKNCDLMEGVLRKSRKICEDKDSPETKKDFKGFFAKDAPAASQPAATQPEATPQVAGSAPPADSTGAQLAQNATAAAVTPEAGTPPSNAPESDETPAAPEPAQAMSVAAIINVPTVLPRPKPFGVPAPMRQAAIYPPQ